jgi:hypothetical protein
VFPNQYIVFVGPPGVGKGNAIHPAHNFVRCPPNNVPLANYIQDRITPASLVEKLAAGFPKITINSNGSLQGTMDSTCVLHASELASLVGSTDWMSTFLCDAWDRSEFTYDTKNKGKAPIKNMCVSLIGACVPSFIRSINKNGHEAINNGFTARTIFIFAEEKSQSVVWPKSLDATFTAKLNNDLQMISRLHGEFFFEPAAQVVFEREYNSIRVDESDSDVIRNFKARQPVHILKVAMALSAAQSDTLIITQWAMETAIIFVTGVLVTLDKCFRGVGDSILAPTIARIQTFIEKRKVCSKVDIIRANLQHVHPNDLETVLIMLLSCGLIAEVPSGRGTKLYKFVGRTSNTP